ncbi:acetate/propionate family kinase [Motiliproteus sp.]|uniref:acetate/propionate family kinase n=1 Tax=Motiliproteus sp. TaxID=1898955 RepID=UPI003BAD7BBD
MSSILTVNGGSSSLKSALYKVVADQPELHYNFKLSNILAQPRAQIKDADGNLITDLKLDFAAIDESGRHQACLDFIFAWINSHAHEHKLTAISHRVVHGGERYSQPVEVCDQQLEQLREYIPLAPLHQPYNLKLIEACHALLPEIPQVACFDTMFHSQMPLEAKQFALPREMYDEGIRRYGFHGLSYEYIYRQLEQRDCAQLNTIVGHLGAGASLCAIKEGLSITSTMGFTALDGPPMGTRCGAIDPGVLLYLMREKAMDVDAIEKLLYKKSGWLGVSGGLTSEMAELLASDSQQAREAVNLFCYRVAREIGSLGAALEGIEQLVFTGGVGENSAEIRSLVCQRSRWLGIEIDDAANRANAEIISTPGSRVCVRVIATDEEQMLAQHALEVLE